MKQFLLLLLLPSLLIAQDGQPMDDMTNLLSNMSMDIAVGNACGINNYLDTNVYGDMDMNYHTLEVLNSRITIHGELLNEGTIVFLCDNAIIDILGPTLSVEQPEEIDTSISVYPNPFTEYIVVKGNSIEVIEVYDLMGRKLKHFQTTTVSNQIMLNDLADGVYLLAIIDSNQNRTVNKIIKQ